MNGLPPEAAVFRIDGRRWTLRDEISALTLEAVDRWGWVLARLKVDPKHHGKLPDRPISFPRPAAERKPVAEVELPEQEPPEKDRYQKQRERIAFFA